MVEYTFSPWACARFPEKIYHQVQEILNKNEVPGTLSPLSTTAERRAKFTFTGLELTDAVLEEIRKISLLEIIVPAKPLAGCVSEEFFGPETPPEPYHADHGV